MQETETALQLGDPKRPGYDACTGCHLCALPCPVWQQTHDTRLTLKGRARALLHGASVVEVRDSTLACVLCGACEAVCPESIDTVGLTLGLRRALSLARENPLADLEVASPPPYRPQPRSGLLVLLSGHFDAVLAEQIVTALGNGKANSAVRASDDGRDLAQRIEAGLEIPAGRQREFVARLPARIVVADGILLRALPSLGYRGHVRSLGEALLKKPAIRKALGPGDLLVIESRAFHAAYARLEGFYVRLRAERACEMNLDLQHSAIATGTTSLQLHNGIGTHDVERQVRWILEGKKIRRVVVEAPQDLSAFREYSDLPLYHLAELALESVGK